MNRRALAANRRERLPARLARLHRGHVHRDRNHAQSRRAQVPPRAAGDARGTREFTSDEEAEASPLAQAIFDTGEVTNVFFGRDFVSVTAAPSVDWSMLKPQVVAILLDHFVSQAPLFAGGDASGFSVPLEPERRGRSRRRRDRRPDPRADRDPRASRRSPSDGGNIEYRGFRDGVVYLQMQGACSGCPSSTATLKHGIESLLSTTCPRSPKSARPSFRGTQHGRTAARCRARPAVPQRAQL